MSDRVVNLLIVVTMMIIASIAGQPPVGINRESANRDACQKNMAFLLDMMKMASMDGLPVEGMPLNDSIPLLVKKGYLQCLATDFGHSVKIDKTYTRLPDGRIFCSNHGIYGTDEDCGKRSPREQLLQLGIEEGLVNRASSRKLPLSIEYCKEKRAETKAWRYNMLRLCCSWIVVLIIYSLARKTSAQSCLK